MKQCFFGTLFQTYAGNGGQYHLSCVHQIVRVILRMFGSHPQDDHDLLQAQHIQNDSHLMNQLLEGDPTFAQAVLGDNLDHFQNSLRQQHQQRLQLEQKIKIGRNRTP